MNDDWEMTQSEIVLILVQILVRITFWSLIASLPSFTKGGMFSSMVWLILLYGFLVCVKYSDVACLVAMFSLLFFS